MAEARERAKEFLPSDARAVRTYRSANDQTVEVFQSQILADAWASAGDVWDGEAAGTFILIAERGRPTSSRIIIAIGNNP